jgi:hypothetical protein
MALILGRIDNEVCIRFVHFSGQSDPQEALGMKHLLRWLTIAACLTAVAAAAQDTQFRSGRKS